MFVLISNKNCTRSLFHVEQKKVPSAVLCSISLGDLTGKYNFGSYMLPKVVENVKDVRLTPKSLFPFMCLMCKESLVQYQQELLSANLTDLNSIKRLNYYVSQFSLTSFSNEIGVKIASAAYHSLSHPLFDEIYVSICIFRPSLGPGMTVH